MLIYCVLVEFNEEYSSDNIDEFLSEKFKPGEVISKKGRKVKLFIEIDEDEGPGDLENDLYVTFDGWKIGTFLEYKEIT